MRFPHTKYGLSYSEIARLTGKSRSAVVREAEKDGIAFQARVNMLMGGHGVSSKQQVVTQYEYWSKKTGEYISADAKVEELVDEIIERESAIWVLLQLLCDLVPASDTALRAKLAPLFQEARGIVKDYPTIEDGLFKNGKFENRQFNLSAPGVSEEEMEKFFEPDYERDER